VVLLAGCGASHARSTPTAATPPTTAAPTTTTTVAATTTTTAVPPDPQSTPDAAAMSFIDAWENGDRTEAATVATPDAVRVLFAHGYSGEVLNDRGCGAPGPNPVVCSWGPYAAASPTNPLYNITMSPHGSAWYVRSVVKET
jgi:hypothetical protein